MSTATLAVTGFECQVVAFLCPQILDALFLTPAASAATGSQVREHFALPLAETIAVHPHTLITRLVVAVHLNDTTQHRYFYLMYNNTTDTEKPKMGLGTKIQR